MNNLFKKIKSDFVWLMCLLCVSLSIFYWAIVASDRYVSEAHIVLQNPEVTVQSTSIASLLSGGNGANKDLLLLANHLLSVDMMLKLEKELALKSHYSNLNIDFISRLSTNPDSVPMETFHKYFLKRVKVEVDDYAGVLNIRVEAFSREMAYAINKSLLLNGEKHMNEMGQRLANEQVQFIQNQVLDLGERLKDSRGEVLGYQNKHGLVSPEATVESLSQVVAGLEADLASLNAKKTAMSDYLSRKSPEIVRLNSEISAMKKQIYLEKSKMTTESGNALNKITAEYETLKLREQFALELYSNALSALESIRVDAIRKLKLVSVLQAPTFPEYSVQPKRLYNITVFLILAILITLIIQMLRAIIEEHKD